MQEARHLLRGQQGVQAGGGEEQFGWEGVVNRGKVIPVGVLFVHHRVQGHQGCQDRVWHYLGDQEVVHYKVFFVAGSSMSKMLEADMKEAKDGS